jgi:hypothetical protein
MNAIATTIDRRGLLVGLASLPVIGGAVALSPPATASDPLAEAIAEYRAGMADFAAIPSDDITMENEEAHVMATYGPSFDRLWHDCPPATSLRGVAEAIRFTIESQSICCSSSENTLRAALAFLDRERVS